MIWSAYLCNTCFSVSLWNDLASSVFEGVGLVGFKSRANASLLAYAALSLL